MLWALGFNNKPYPLSDDEKGLKARFELKLTSTNSSNIETKALKDVIANAKLPEILNLENLESKSDIIVKGTKIVEQDSIINKDNDGHVLLAIKDMRKANNDVADVTFWSSFIPFITPQMKIVGHLANNDTIKKTEYYKNAYDNGMGIQIITRLNPDYDGYNAKTLVENHNQCIKKKYEGSFIHDRSKDKLIHNEEWCAKENTCEQNQASKWL